MPNFVYLNVKCAQHVNMEIIKEQSSLVLRLHPHPLHADHVQMPAPPLVDPPPPSVQRLRRFAKFLFDFKHLHKTQSILLRSFRLPVQLNPI